MLSIALLKLNSIFVNIIIIIIIIIIITTTTTTTIIIIILIAEFFKKFLKEAQNVCIETWR